MAWNGCTDGRTFSVAIWEHVRIHKGRTTCKARSKQATTGRVREFVRSEEHGGK